MLFSLISARQPILFRFFQIQVVFFATLFIQAGAAFAGQGEVDSLRQLLAKEKNDTVRVNLELRLGAVLLDTDSLAAEKYFSMALSHAYKTKEHAYILRTYERISKRYYYCTAFRTGINYLRKGLVTAHRWKEKDWEMKLYERMADLLHYQSMSKQCIPYYDSAYQLTPSTAFHQRAELLMQKGRAYYDIGDYKSAMSLYIESQRIFEAQKIADRSYGHLLHYIGSVFKRQGEYRKALGYYEKEMQLAHAIDDRRLEAEASYLSAAMYGSLGDPEKELEYELKALKIYEEEHNERSMALLMGNISGYYADHKDFVKAIDYCRKALEIYTRSGDNEKTAWVLQSLGNYSSHLGQHARAIAYIKQALEVNEKVETKHLLTKAEILESMAFAYSRMGNYKSAFETYLEYRVLEDSISNDSNREYLQELEKQYDTEKKEQQIALLEKDKKMSAAEIARKNAEADASAAQRNVLIIGCVLMLVIAGISVWAFINKRKSNQLLARQFSEIQTKNLIIQEKNKDITDSINYAKRIQEAVLPLPEELNNFFSESFVFFRPKDIVSGDFYWFTHLGNKAILAVGDCTGHGVPGAFMSIIGHDLLNQIVMEEKLYDPAEILRVLDKRVSATLNKKGSKQEYQDGMDIAVCLFDRDQKTIAFAGANRPLVIKKGTDLVELPASKFAIGGTQDSRNKVFNQYEHQLNEDDVVYVFSDGYHDQFGGITGKKLKYHQLKQYIKGLSQQKVAEHYGFFANMFDEWKGDLEQVDDVCVIGVKV